MRSREHEDFIEQLVRDRLCEQHVLYSEQVYSPLWVTDTDLHRTLCDEIYAVSIQCLS